MRRRVPGGAASHPPCTLQLIKEAELHPAQPRAAQHPRESIGHGGQAFRFFAVPDVALSACGTGAVQVRYERESYSYRLPAPGCGQAPPR